MVRGGIALSCLPAVLICPCKSVSRDWISAKNRRDGLRAHHLHAIAQRLHRWMLLGVGLARRPQLGFTLGHFRQRALQFGRLTGRENRHERIRGDRVRILKQLLQRGLIVLELGELRLIGEVVADHRIAAGTVGAAELVVRRARSPARGIAATYRSCRGRVDTDAGTRVLRQRDGVLTERLIGRFRRAKVLARGIELVAEHRRTLLEVATLQLAGGAHEFAHHGVEDRSRTTRAAASHRHFEERASLRQRDVHAAEQANGHLARIGDRELNGASATERCGSRLPEEAEASPNGIADGARLELHALVS